MVAEDDKERLREAESKLAEARAFLEAIEAVLEGEPVSDFMSSFPVVMKAQQLFDAANNPTVILGFDSEGEFVTATVLLEAQLEGCGTSRNKAKALSYALEDLAAKVRAGVKA